MKQSKINIAVFTQSTELGDIITIIQNSNNTLPFLLLSSHRLFDTERSIILRAKKQQVIFMSFADFLTDDEMSWCDTHVYEIESKQNPLILRSLNEYYQCIKTKKNELILTNIRRKYQLAEKYLCADDLGIAVDVWFNEGFANHIQHKQDVTEISLVSTAPVTKNGRVSHIFNDFRGIYRSPNKILGKLFVLKTPVGKYLFWGSTIRIRPHLDNVRIKPLQPGFVINLVISFLMYILKPFNRLRKTIVFHLQSKIISRYATSYGISTLLTTMHEYRLGHTNIAASLNMDLVILQDGFLPENYSSRYLDFFFGVREFWVWDRLSLGLFENQSLKAEVCSFLSAPKLPLIEKSQNTVKTILVLTSGAGDWTALKNRSDEDLLVMAFAKVAKEFPKIKIIYRCHPLWAHKEHQGVDSIKRVDEYFKQLHLSNLSVSEGSLDQSKRFLKDQGLWVATGSTESDIEEADLIFGEHSFSMIEAAQRGILFASVNLSRRRDFFHNYSKLGFYHLKSKEEIISFIEQFQELPVRIIKNHNEAVRRYNTKWHR